MSHDGTVACVRCWEHEDCREHPELAVACAAVEDRHTYAIHHHDPPAGGDAQWQLCSDGYGDGKFMTDGLNYPPGDGGGYGYGVDELSLTIRADDYDIERLWGNNYQRAVQNNCGSVG